MLSMERLVNTISRISITLVAIGIILVLGLLIIKPANQPVIHQEKAKYNWHALSIVSVDQMKIWAAYALPENTQGVAVLIHGLREDSSLWNATNVSLKLLEHGLAVFTLDLRGHGLSIYRANGTLVKVKDLKPEDYGRMVLDVQSLIMSAESIAGEKPLFIICSDIGCSIATRLLDTPWGKDIQGIVMISPVLENEIGIDFKALEDYRGDIFVIYSELDKASVQAMEALKNAIRNASIIYYVSKTPGHGLNLVLADRSIPNRIISVIDAWLSEKPRI